jgi:hypothetical protein
MSVQGRGQFRILRGALGNADGALTGREFGLHSFDRQQEIDADLSVDPLLDAGAQGSRRQRTEETSRRRPFGRRAGGREKRERGRQEVGRSHGCGA